MDSYEIISENGEGDSNSDTNKVKIEQIEQESTQNIDSIKIEDTLFETEEYCFTRPETSAVLIGTNKPGESSEFQSNKLEVCVNADGDLFFLKPENFSLSIENLENSTINSNPDIDAISKSLIQTSQKEIRTYKNNTKTRKRRHAIIQGNQRTMKHYDDNSELLDTLTKLITGTLLNLNIVQDKNFRKYVTYLQPACTLPTKEDMSKHIKQKYDIMVCDLKSIIVPESTSVCISVEKWTSLQSEIYQSVTAHFVSPTMKFRSVLLDCYYCGTEDFNVEHASYAPREILAAWNLHDKVNSVVYDGCDIITEAYSKYIKVPHFRCYARTLIDIVKRSLTEFESTTKKLKIMARLWFESTQDENIESDLSEFAASIESPTWLYMLKVVTEKYDELFNYYIKGAGEEEEQIYENILTQEEVHVCKELHSLMKPFEEVIQFMCSEKYLTAGMPIVITCILLKCLMRAQEETYSEIITRLLRQLLESLKELSLCLEENEVLSICTFLDPRFKLFFFSNESAADTIKRKIHQMIVSILKEKSPKTSKTSVNSNTKSVWDIFEEMTRKEDAKESTIATKEIDRYLGKTLANRWMSPFTWWSQSRSKFPNLSYLAQNKCGYVFSCSPCKSIFTRSGKFITSQRSQLNKENVRHILFLNANINNFTFSVES